MHGSRHLVFVIILAMGGCSAAGDLQRGRAALLSGMPETAVVHFRNAAAAKGGIRYSQLGQGIWTYLGRAFYDAKRYAEARESLERAVVANNSDGFARLYLGLTLARQGENEPARKELLAGLRSLSEQLNFIIYNTESGHFWDPTGELRRDLNAAHGAVASAGSDIGKLLPRLEAIGIALEREIDAASKDQTIQLNRRFGDQ